MSLQIGGLVGNQRVGRRMGFVKTVTRKGFHLIEDLCGLLRINFFLFRAFDEPFALRRHLFRIFFPHGTPQNIGVSHAVAAKHLGDLHYLFLIDDDPVGIFEDRLRKRMQVFVLLSAVLALDVFFRHPAIQRAGSVKRQDGHQIFETVGADLDGHLANARAFKLKHAGGIAVAQELVSFLVVQRETLQINFDSLGHLDELDAVVEQGQGLET